MTAVDYPKTQDEWWALLNGHWLDVKDILWRYLPLSKREHIPKPGEGPVPTRPMYMIIDALREKEDPHIARYLNAAWGAAPDHPSIRSIPGWDVLCDLCSEEWVFNDENEEDEVGQEETPQDDHA